MKKLKLGAENNLKEKLLIFSFIRIIFVYTNLYFEIRQFSFIKQNSTGH